MYLALRKSLRLGFKLVGSISRTGEADDSKGSAKILGDVTEIYRVNI